MGTIRSRLKRGMKLEDILTMAPMGVPAGYKGLKRFESEYTNKCTKEIAMKCVNCERRFEDGNGVCKSCGHTICAECLATARRRRVNRPTHGYCGTAVDPNRMVTEYLCSLCCGRQDAARRVLGVSVTDQLQFRLFAGASEEYPYWPERLWFDDIVESLKAAIEKAEEAL